MKIIDVEQGSPEWVALRKNKIGASDAPVLMEVSPFSTPYQLWMDKMGLLEKEDNAAMARGRELEPIARDKFFDITGIEMFPKVGLHKTIDFMMASFDGISENRLRALEIKCPGYKDHETAMDGVIPEKYIPQLQHQMEVANISSMFYFSFSEKSYKLLEINRDDRYIEKMIQKEKAFWDCMQNLEAPDLIDRDYVERNDEEWNQLAQEYQEILKIENRKEEIRQRLIQLSGNLNSMGGGIKLSKINKKGNIDYKAIPELKEMDLERYRKSRIETYRIGIC